MKGPLIVLAGPTGVGKTALSIRLAKAVGGEIVSADSMQVYRGMDIGSAKIRPEETEGVPHHLIDVLDPTEPFHVVRFQEMAEKAIREITARGCVPILVGGTGFYIQAVTRDIHFTEEDTDLSIREELTAYAKEHGAEALHRMLRDADPDSADAIPPGNVKRVTRALEYYRLTGLPISAHNRSERQRETPYRLAYFVLNIDRPVLYERIDRRVDRMMEEGLTDEVKRLLAAGVTPEMTSMQGLGYREILRMLNGEWDEETAVYKIKQNTRHFAKRQITWFKREPDAVWLDKGRMSEEEMLSHMLTVCREKEVI